MNKKEFLSKIAIDDANLLGNIYDKYRLCVDTGMKVGTEEFYSPDIWSEIDRIKNHLEVNTIFEGPFEYSERRRIYFMPKDSEYYEMENENVKLCLINKSLFKNLEHKDYLGAIMSLGIKRELVSDLVVDGSKCYFMTNKSVAHMIENNIKQAGRNPIEVEILEEDFKMPLPKFEEEIKVVSSLRLDAIISLLVNVSRNDAVDLILSKKVVVDYKINIDKSYSIKENSVISIRKGGKFIFVGILGNTKKDKIRIKIKRFV
jgi:RNA-binding protein YlmH